MSAVQGTPDYMAPEFYIEERCTDNGQKLPRDHFKGDIWAIGCIAFYILARKVPFQGYHALFCYHQGTALLPALKMSSGPASETARAFVAALLHVRPQARPDTRTCQAHPWLQPKDDS